MAFVFDPKNRQMYGNEYVRQFNQENKNWDSLDNNEIFLKLQQDWLNDKLKARGHLFLNEVYDVLGFPRVPSGQLIGWFHQDGRVVDLRLTKKRDGSIMIEFNVTDNDAIFFKI